MLCSVNPIGEGVKRRTLERDVPVIDEKIFEALNERLLSVKKNLDQI